LSGRDYVLAEGGSYSIEALKISGTQILVRRGDSLDRWLKHILSIRTCITLWEKARAGDQPFLKSVIVLISREEQLEWMSALVRFSSTGVILPAETYFANPLPLKVMGRLGGKRVPLGEPGGIYYAPAAEAEPPASFYTGQRVGFPVTSDVNDDRCIGGFGVTYPAGSIDDQDPVALARALVTTEIMRNLSAGVAPVIEPHPSVAWGELRFVPATLIDAVWLQFAEAVCGDKNFRECLVCGKPFEISPDVARTNKLLCSDSCKMRAYRQRKAKSAELWDQGYSVQEVAGALGSDVKKVAKWLAQHMAGREESVDEIAKQLRVKPAEVRKLLSKKGG
jgi:predicted nucleic acid-binding Zn ribbon protein